MWTDEPKKTRSSVFLILKVAYRNKWKLWREDRRNPAQSTQNTKHFVRNGSTVTALHCFINQDQFAGCQGFSFMSPDSWSYETEAVTVPLMQTRQMGQFWSCCEQSAQQTKCPHGRNTVFTSASMHTLHVLSSRNFSFSLIISAVGTESRHTVAAHDDQL